MRARDIIFRTLLNGIGLGVSDTGEYVIAELREAGFHLIRVDREVIDEDPYSFHPQRMERVRVQIDDEQLLEGGFSTSHQLLYSARDTTGMLEAQRRDLICKLATQAAEHFGWLP